MEERIRKIVAALIKRYGTRNVFRIADDLGLIVVYRPLGQHYYGFINRCKRSTFIVVNERLDERYHACVIAHEIGHFVMHKGINQSVQQHNPLNNNSKLEREANMFACLLLFNEAWHSDSAFLVPYDEHTMSE